MQVPGVSMRPPPCTDADDLLRCTTVGNLGEGRAKHRYLYKALHGIFLVALRTGQSTQDLHFNHESVLYVNGAGRESNPGPLAFSASVDRSRLIRN